MNIERQANIRKPKINILGLVAVFAVFFIVYYIYQLILPEGLRSYIQEVAQLIIKGL